MLPRLLLVSATFALALRVGAAAVATNTPDSITGVYIPGWAQDTTSVRKYFNISDMNLRNVSHMYYAFLWIYGENYTVYDPFWNLPLLTELKARWPATKLILSIGGGGFNTTIWSEAATRGLAAFVNSAIAAVKAAKADGIDLDWESPGAADRAAFTALCATLRARLDKEGAAASPPRHYWLTAATQSIVSEGSFAGFDLAALKKSVDLFNIMTYTMHDPCYWETQTHFHTAWTDCSKALEYYIAQGVPAPQLVLGLAFYGHVYTLVDPTQYMYPAPSVESRDCSTMTTMAYRDVMFELSWVGGGVFTDSNERSAYYVKGTKWVGFDIRETFASKIQGSKSYGIGGVMIWDASLELPDGALLRSIATRQPPTVRPCGGGFVGTGQCAVSSQCCSEFGYCGTTQQQCGAGCRGGPCIKYPSPPPRPPSPPPNCDSGIVGSGICSDSTLCCSQYGWCGDTADYCAAGCSGGPCWNKPKPPPLPPGSPPPPSPPPPPPLPYGCGNGDVGNGTCLLPNLCCSSAGYCGDSEAHCGYGCKGGPCIKFPPPPPGGGGPMCGNGVIGNGQCGYKGFCCSKWGYCGWTVDHCGPGCQGGDCWYPPPPPTNKTASPPPTVRRSPPPSPQPSSPQPRAGQPKPPRSPSPPPKPSPTPKPPPSPKPPPRPPKPPPRPPKSPPRPPKSPPRKPPSPPPSPLFPPPEAGTCGDGSVGNGICPDPSECCSAAGYCAVSEDHCYWFCVGGPCWDPPPPPRLDNVTYPPSPPPPAPGTVYCGDGVVGNRQCALKHMCCSAAGWCWNDYDHCGPNCVGGPCWNPPPPPLGANQTAPPG